MDTVVTILVNFNSRPQIDRAIESVLEQNLASEHHVVVWENGDDAELRGLELGSSAVISRKWLHYIGSGQNFGYAPAVQKAWNWVQSCGWADEVSFVHMAGPDTYSTSSSALDYLCSRARCMNAVVGPAMRDKQGRIRLSSYPLLRPYNVVVSQLTNGWISRLGKIRSTQPASRNVGTLDGSYVVFPRVFWDRLGGLDNNYFLYTDDHDVCRRAERMGMQRWCDSSVEVVHEGGTSRVSRRLLCRLERVRCHLRYVDQHFGGSNSTALRRILSLEHSGVVGDRDMAWWALNAPTSFEANGCESVSIEEAYLSWLSYRNENEAGRLYESVEAEIRGRNAYS
ncbi:GT2 family glycosyltransferase [Saccharomonospora amisosensis]|uniref:GT2 family glycosyltransferase n=1 Tax=Saccharomonospora amisosensis TaxID=1128677 RepID=A0A7X5UNV6_9PSEU|nr:glycosyltransferase family 2 protein [Saccharomonospora amisosensis]NIJ11450.1 GT2 family glycosyltransferase [Saccharomonospora amisosensis]